MLDIFTISDHARTPIPQDRFLGRVLVTPTRSFILEDSYDALLNIFNNEDANATLMQLKNLAMNPMFTVTASGDSKNKEVPVLESPINEPLERKWLYTAPGEPEPKILLLLDNKYLLNGLPLNSDSLAEITSTLQSGEGQLKAIASLKKHESESKTPGQLTLPGMEAPVKPSILPEAKTLPVNSEDILSHLQSLVGKHGLNQEHIDHLRSDIFKDPLTGLGNRKAWEQFSAKAKPGIYASLDLNNLKNINLQHGHLGGDEAIRSFGQAMRQAGDAVGSEHMKLHHISGDEFIAHAPSHEHMNNFVQTLHQNLNELPPIGGQSNVSGSIGLGNDYATADKALYAAKDAKIAHMGKGSSAIGQTPNFAHSLIPGAEGAIALAKPKMAKSISGLGTENDLKKFTKSNPKGVFVSFKGGNTGVDMAILDPIVLKSIQNNSKEGKAFLKGKTYQIFVPTRTEAENIMEEIRENLLKGDE